MRGSNGQRSTPGRRRSRGSSRGQNIACPNSEVQGAMFVRLRETARCLRATLIAPHQSGGRMIRMRAAAACKPALLTVALATVVSTIGCATGSLTSHGVDYTPAFDAPRYGNLGIEPGFLTGSPTE